MKRPPKPDIRVGDQLLVEAWAWQPTPPWAYGTHQTWAPTGTTYEAVAGEAHWDSWLEGGVWAVNTPGSRHAGRVATGHVRVIGRPNAWSEPDLFEAVSA